MATKRIICVGNRFIREDSAGPEVYEYLATHPLPPGIELIDGGLSGLNLLRLFSGAERVVLVDSAIGHPSHRRVYVVNPEDMDAIPQNGYGHASGLEFLLKTWSAVSAGSLPEIRVVAIEGIPDPESVARAAEISISLATGVDSLPLQARCREGRDTTL